MKSSHRGGRRGRRKTREQVTGQEDNTKTNTAEGTSTPAQNPRNAGDEFVSFSRVSFEQEYILFLKKNGFAFDPRYVFG